ALPRRAAVAARHAAAVLLPAPLVRSTPVEAASTLYPAKDGNADPVRTISGTTDPPLFAFFIEAFQAQRPDIGIVYEEWDSLPLYQGFLDRELGREPDLLISSASDLQLKLANDGYALGYDSPYLADLPDWAHWRSEVFGFTFEPAVIIYNPHEIAASEVPRTHLTLAELLETQTE